MKRRSAFGLIPIAVFVLIYLSLGIVFEYGMQIPEGFYSVPVVVAFLVALLVACLQSRGITMDQKLTIMGTGVGDKNIITMLLIFLLAGIFVGVAGRSSAQSVAYFVLSFTSPQLSVCMLFLISCFISTAMGTSVGTISLITPIAVAIANSTGYSLPLCVATVVGGAMFGDNLSFISDTTIAACTGQGCRMRDKFRMNFAIVVPAAVITIGIILLLTFRAQTPEVIHSEYNLIHIIPYVLVLGCGIFGVNVFLTLILGILSGSIIMLSTGTLDFFHLILGMKNGAAGMFETAMVAVLVAALCALIRENGGFESLLRGIRRVFRGKKGGQLGIGLLVGLMDIATANNTVAIVMANPIAAEMSSTYGISPRRTASILDTFSCIFQGFLPYGAQILAAISVVAAQGEQLSAFEVIRHLYYPLLLLISSLVFIFIVPERKKAKEDTPAVGEGD